MERPQPDSWFVTLRNPLDIWQTQPSFLCWEYLSLLEGFLTFRHAWRNGGRWIYLWFAIVLHGLVAELISYNLPDVDNFWHSQATVTLWAQRLPLAIMSVYPTFIYTASVAASKLNLKWWAEPFAVGLLTVLLDIPFDITGTKLLWWTWHDTDPNISDRNYWVPWTSYYFHASFASALTLLIHGFRQFITRREKYSTDTVLKESICVLLTSLLATPLGVLQFVPVYHPLHDLLDIHTEVCACLLFTLYALFVWTGRGQRDNSTDEAKPKWNSICTVVTCHYLFHIINIFLAKPENVVATGHHQPIGNCEDTVPVYTPIGLVLSKGKYLCPTNYDEACFDWHCLPDQAPPNITGSWYTICGTPMVNSAEYRIVVGGVSYVGLFIFLQLLLNTGWKSSTKAKAKLIKKE